MDQVTQTLIPQYVEKFMIVCGKHFLQSSQLQDVDANQSKILKIRDSKQIEPPNRWPV